MKRTILMAITMASLFIATAVAQIYPPRQGDLAASIPFEFGAAGKSMPAGEYIIRNDSDTGKLLICEDGVYCADVQVLVAPRAESGSLMRLVFQKSGGRLHLKAVEGLDGDSVRLPDCRSIQDGQQCETVAVPARVLTITRIPGVGVSWS